MGASRGQSLSYLLLPVLGQQQAELCQLLLDDLLVNHVELQAGLWVFRERFVLRAILIIAAFTPPFFFLVTSGKLQVKEWGTHAPPPSRPWVVRNASEPMFWLLG